MTILATMRNAAARARGPLAESDGAGAVVDFLLGHLCDDGGFSGRSPGSDVYYTVFALMSLEALGAEMPAATAHYLAALADGAGLDLVHLASLARCRAIVHGDCADDAVRDGMLANLAALRCPDGGYTHVPGSDRPTAYGCFLALGAMQDLAVLPVGADNLGACIESMRSADGAYANVPSLPAGSTSATAAAVVTLRDLDLPAPGEIAPWLMSQCRDGGFLAVALAPAPDLLSTATALHALAALDAPLEPIVEPCLDFVESLWTGEAFTGHVADDTPDCEYTFYGLLAIGHLSKRADA